MDADITGIVSVIGTIKKSAQQPLKSLKMAYTDFSLAQVKKTFSLVEQRADLFANLTPLEPSDWLNQALDIGLELALSSSSEKARSEFIVVPILFELERRNNKNFAIYSGEKLDVDKELGLVGECDFLLAKNKVAHTLQTPILAVVEAKKNDIASGLGQCAAQMLAAHIFNLQENTSQSSIFGCVTTGEDWQFMRLQDKDLFIDSKRYYIDNVGIILAIFQSVFDDSFHII
jgi:hypothetical protein